jgi:hypothetical protein
MSTGLFPLLVLDDLDRIGQGALCGLHRFLFASVALFDKHRAFGRCIDLNISVAGAPAVKVVRDGVVHTNARHPMAIARDPAAQERRNRKVRHRCPRQPDDRTSEAHPDQRGRRGVSMPRKPTGGYLPVFADGAQYVQVTKRYLDQLARMATFPQPNRVAFYAMAHANRDGHAQLQRNELHKLLGSNGVLASPSTVSRGLSGLHGLRFDRRGDQQPLPAGASSRGPSGDWKNWMCGAWSANGCCSMTTTVWADLDHWRQSD